MLVVAYMRYSSENQRDGYSIEAQQRAIDEYCQRMGWTIVHYYKDEAMTGTNDNRKDFLQMIADAATGNFQGVVVHKFDRFSRDKYDNAIYKRELRNYGIRVHSVLEQLDDSPESLILETLLEGMAQYYSENLSREVKKGLKEKALKGKWCGGIPPYGYIVDEKTEYLKVVPDEAEIVRLIFDMYNNGTPVQEIANHLNSLGYKTKATEKKKGIDFSSQTVRSILRNEKYNGTFMFSKRKKIKTKTGSTQRKQKDSDVIVVEGVVPKIIEDELWISVQNRLNSNTYNTTRAKVQYLLNGLMVCRECGAPYVGGGSVPRYDKNGNEVARYNFYICSKKRKTHDCIATQVSKERIENAVINGIIEHCYNDKSIRLFADDFQKWYAENANDNEAQLMQYREELKKLEAQKARLVALALDGVFSPLETKQQKDAIELKISAIEPKIRSMEHKDIPDKKDLIRFMEETRRQIESGEFDDYAGLIRQHLARVEVYKGYQKIILKKVPYLTEPDENFSESSATKSISDSTCNSEELHSVSLMKKELPKELTITLILEKGKHIATLVA